MVNTFLWATNTPRKPIPEAPLTWSTLVGTHCQPEARCSMLSNLQEREFATRHHLSVPLATEILGRVYSSPPTRISPYIDAAVITELSACRNHLQAAASTLGRGRLGTAVQEAATNAEDAINTLHGIRAQTSRSKALTHDADTPATAPAAQHLQLAHDHATAATAALGTSNGLTTNLLRELLTVYADWIAAAQASAPTAPKDFPVPRIAARRPKGVPRSWRPAATRTSRQIRRCP